MTATLTLLTLLAAPSTGVETASMSMATAIKGEGPVEFGFELRTGPYRPKVSSNRAARRYFNLVYSKNDGSIFKGQPLLTSLEGSWFFYDGVGLAGLIFGVSYWSVEGKTRFCPDNAETCDPTTQETVPGNSKTSLTFLPVNVGLTYRFNLFKEWWAVPVVPYAKAGVSYTFWWDRVDGKISERPDSDLRGEGATLGFDVAGGVMLNLDWIEPGVTRRARNTGMAGTYLFGEVKHIFGSGLSNHSFDVSDTLISLGLAVEFL